MTGSWLFLLGGLCCAGVGGEVFLRGAVGVARWLRIPAGIVGATVAAFATSSPELSVAVRAGLAGTPEVSLGDALGSNVVNVGLILGLALLLKPLQVHRAAIRRDFPVALAAPLVTGVLLYDGVLSRLDGAVMWLGFAVWVTFVTLEARRSRDTDVEDVLAPRNRWTMAPQLVAGLVLLVLAGRLIVDGAVPLASALGMSTFAVGATVVAVGTSVPELATTLLARMRGHDDVGLGTVLGSNIFNNLAIVGTAAVLHPISVSFAATGPALLMGCVMVAATYPLGTGLLRRKHGAALLVFYAVYVVAVAQQGGAP